MPLVRRILLKKLHGLCVFCTGLGFISLSTSTLSAATIEDLEFALIQNNTEYSVSAKDPKTISGVLTIPSNYNGKPVTWIQTHAFKNCTALTSVIFPETLISIGDWAFYGCTALATADLSQTNIALIGERTFAECTALASVLLPEGIRYIQDLAFQNCRSLTSIDLSQTAITSIKSGTFNGCTALASVALPNTINFIGSEAFRDCSALASIDLSQTAIIALGSEAFLGCTALASIDLSKANLASIASGMFNGCKALASVLLPNSITSIGSEAFKNCSALASITVPNTVNSIGSWAFSGCFALASIDLSQLAITAIEAGTFDSCTALTSFVLPNTVNSIGDRAFFHCNHLASLKFLGSAPNLESDDVFTNTGSNLGGLTFTIYESHEASYASWSRDVYTFNVIGGSTTGPVILVLQPSYNPTSKVFSMITKGEDSAVALVLQHTDNLGGTWVAVNTSAYTKATDANSGTVTRTVTLDPATQPRGFYRLISE